MKTITLKNVYGFPVLNDRIIDYIKESKYKLVVGISDLEDLENDDSFKIVLTGMAMLASFNIPVIGYTKNPNGMWTKSALPSRLKQNEVEVRIFKIGKALPKTKKLYKFFAEGKSDDTFSSRFVREHETECLNERVFKKQPANLTTEEQ